MSCFLGNGELMLVETAGDRFLGTVELVGDEFIVRSGFVGRPTVVLPEDVVQLVLASELELDEE